MFDHMRRLGLAIAVLLSGVGAASAQDRITMRLTQPWPAVHPQWEHGGQVFIDHVTEATGGRVEFEVYHSAQLGNDALGLLSSGLTDIAIMSTGYAPDRMPLSNVTEMPGLFVGSCEANRKLAQIGTEGGPLYEHEYKGLGIRPIYFATSPAASIVMGSKKVERLGDLKGLKLRASGGGFTATAQGMGAVPVQTVASELYDSIKRGTIDGAMYYYVGMPSFSLEEVFGTGVDNLRLGASSVIAAMSDKRWNALPPEIQQAIRDGAAKAAESICTWFDANDALIRDQMIAERGFTLTSLPEEDIAEWQKLQVRIADDWAALMDRNGRKGTEVLTGFRAAE